MHQVARFRDSHRHGAHGELIRRHLGFAVVRKAAGNVPERDDRDLRAVVRREVPPQLLPADLHVAAAAPGELWGYEDLRLCARTLGATPRYTMLRVQIRSALPGILTGMRISMAGTWTSIVAAELIAATSGLGYLIMQAGDYLNTALVFSGIIMIAILGLALDACLRGLLLLADPSRRR